MCYPFFVISIFLPGNYKLDIERLNFEVQTYLHLILAVSCIHVKA